MQYEKICCNLPSEKLGVINQPDYFSSKDVWLSLSETMTKLTQTVNAGAFTMAKLYCGNEAVMSLSKIAVENSFNEIYGAFQKIRPATYNWGAVTETLLNATKIARQFTINTQELFKAQEKILKLYEPIKIDTYGLEEMFSELHQRLNEMVQAIPDEDYDVLLKDTEYTKDDVLEELDVFVQTEINTTNEYSLIWQDESLTPDEKIGKIAHLLYKKYPVLGWIVLFVVAFTKACDISECYNENISPMVENAIVCLEGNQDIYFVDVEDGARLYQYADTKSDVIMYIDFTEQVEVIDEINYWSQVRYIDDTGNEMIGWMAKKNLLPYKDWKYNASKLYSGVE